MAQVSVVCVAVADVTVANMPGLDVYSIHYTVHRRQDSPLPAHYSGPLSHGRPASFNTQELRLAQF